MADLGNHFLGGEDLLAGDGLDRAALGRNGGAARQRAAHGIEPRVGLHDLNQVAEFASLNDGTHLQPRVGAKSTTRRPQSRFWVSAGTSRRLAGEVVSRCS